MKNKLVATLAVMSSLCLSQGAWAQVKEIRVLMKAVAQRKGKKVSVEIMD